MTRYAAADLAVLVTGRATARDLATVVDGLRAQTVQDFEVVVAVEDAALDQADGIRVVPGPLGGAAASVNAARRQTQRALLVLLDAQAMPEPDLVERHLAFHERHGGESVVAVGRVEPAAAASAFAAWVIRCGTRLDPDANTATTDEEVSYLAFDGRNLSLPAGLFDNVGGFDEAFGFAFGDIECGLRLAETGARFLAEPAAAVRVRGPLDWDEAAWLLDVLGWSEYQMAVKHRSFTPVLASRLRGENGSHESDRRRLATRFLESWPLGRDLQELQEYLGPRFDWNVLFRHHAAVDEEEEAAVDEATFYRTSDAYLYDLTVFALSRTKAPYIAHLRDLVPAGARILDYGCGIGADGLLLLEAGYHVSFADFDNPSTRYLKWRLSHRGLDAPVHDIDRSVPGGFDLAYSFDVIEHVDDPFPFLHELESRADVVMVNLLEPDPDDTHLHRPLPITALLRHAERRGLLRYRRYYGRSHLIAYRAAGTPGLLGALRSRWQRWAGPHLGAIADSRGST